MKRNTWQTILGILGLALLALGLYLVKTTNATEGILLTLPVFMGEGFTMFLIAVACAYFGAAIVTYLFGYNDSMLEAEKKG